MLQKSLALLSVFLLLSAAIPAPKPEKRIALLIGNGDYAPTRQPGWLKCPENDAKDLARALEGANFDEIEIAYNRNRRQMIDLLNAFHRRIAELKNSGSHVTALFYFSGHGVQDDSRNNFLLPLEYNIDKLDDLEHEAIVLERVLNNMQNADLKICFIDACRNNPFKKSWVSITKNGLPDIGNDGFSEKVNISDSEPSSSIEQARGYCISFAAAPGTAALDGNKRNSPYAQALISTLSDKANVALPTFLQEVKNRVYALTRGKQQSWVRDGTLGYFYFVQEKKENIDSTTPREEFPRSYTESATGTPFNMQYVKGGAFQLGDITEEGESVASQKTRVSEFWMAETEVTNLQFCAFLNAQGNKSDGGVTWLDINDPDCLITRSREGFMPKPGYAEHPVTEVSWYGAVAYCEWLTDRSSRDYRLPTATEWEYAARNRGQKVQFGNGKSTLSPKEANFNESRRGTVAVKSFAGNPLGLYDMTGNVWEWCQDSALIMKRVLRGGSWKSPEGCTEVTHSHSQPPTNRGSDKGFRVVSF